MNHDGWMGWGMGFGGWDLLIWLVVILAGAALVKYLFFNKRDGDDK